MGAVVGASGWSERDRAAIRQMFAGASRDVELAVYRRGAMTQAGERFLRALAGVQAFVQRLKVSMHEYTDAEKVVERAPGVALLDGDGADLRVRFYGWPSEYEFSSLVTTAADAASGGTALQAATLEALAGLKSEVQIKVFTTPT